jgi:7-cyano-7-deazaguanine tRNA-ribosyltransferase
MANSKTIHFIIFVPFNISDLFLLCPSVPTYLCLIGGPFFMPDCFEILHKDLAGRIGKLTTPHGSVETPALMPVVNPHLRLLEAEELKGLGAKMLITNSYIINQDETLREAALQKGLHSLLKFEGPIMTDSGAFQLSVYGQVDVEPLEIIEFQDAIHSDICVPLDIPTPPDVPRERAVSEAKETQRRLEQAIEHRPEKSLLAGPIQGSTYPDLREEMARNLRDMNFDVYPIGAVVPLMERYRFRDLVNVVAASKKGLGSGAPVHLFGAGHPMVFALAAAMGCDLFDSAAYALYAKQGRYMMPSGTWKLDEMKYLPCSCPVCQGHDHKELAKSPDRVKLLAMHNLHVSFAEIALVKQSIWEGSLWDLVETRCRSHPRMVDGLMALSLQGRWLESLDAATKSTFFYLSPESASRPEVIRYESRLDRLELGERVLITDGSCSGSEDYDTVLHFKPPFGPYPPELSETYPLNAEVPEKPDSESINQAMRNVRRLIDLNPRSKFTLALNVPGGVLE